MRKWSWVLGAFLAAAGCEDSQPRQREAPIVKMELPRIEAPKVIEPATPEVKVAPPVAAVEEGRDDEELKPGEAIDEARQAMGEGQLDRSLKRARVAVTKAPGRSAAWNTLGRVQLARGERKDARASFEKAVELNPKSSWAQNNLGLTLIYQGQYEDAVEALESATELEPVESYMWNNLGMAYEHLDRLEEARDAYLKAADLDSGRAKDNLARLEGVKSVFRTAKLENSEVKETGAAPKSEPPKDDATPAQPAPGPKVN
jgi:Flp pilus assembly protein TadD